MATTEDCEETNCGLSLQTNNMLLKTILKHYSSFSTTKNNFVILYKSVVCVILKTHQQSHYVSVESWLLPQVMHPKGIWIYTTTLPSFSIVAAHADSIHIPPRRWFHSRDLSWWTHVGLVVCQHASNHSRDKTGISEMWLTQGTAPHVKENPVSTQWIPVMNYI